MRILIACGIAVCAAAQTINVTPPKVMMDEAVVVKVSALAPNEHAIVRAELTDGGGQQWASQAEYAADENGAIDVSRRAPVAGSYKELSPMGLVWSMMPASKHVSTYQSPRDLGPQTIEFTLMRKNEKLAKARLEQITLAEGVRRSVVRDGPLRGVFFAPPGEGRHPGVLVVGGSNGGLPAKQAAWLASHGFAALALAYFRYEDLPLQLEGIPLEYFGRALEWMAQQKEIVPDHLAVMGTSRGGELALQLGSMFPSIRAVVAFVPADVRYASCCLMKGTAAWTWQGQALPYLAPRFGRPPDVVARAAIEVERTHGPILMISAEDDHLWRSWEMADNVVARLKRTHFPYRFENLKYPHAGHSAGRPGIQPAWHGAVRNPTSGRENDLGGTAKGDAQSTIDSMPKVIEFLTASARE